MLLFSNFRDDVAGIGTVFFTFEMKVLTASKTSHKTVSCLDVYLPRCSNTLETLKICAEIQTSLVAKRKLEGSK